MRTYHLNASESEREQLKERILSKIKKDEKGCWKYAGFLKHERPHIRIDNSNVDLRRLVYDLWHHPIEKQRVYVKCRVQSCVNPEHLDLLFPIEGDRARFLQKIEINEQTGCWIWKGCINKHNNTPEFHLGKVVTTAGRAAWTLYLGPIPKHHKVSHKDVSCSRLCANPVHLILMPMAQKTARFFDTSKRNRESKRQLAEAYKLMDCGHVHANLMGPICRVCSEISDLKAELEQLKKPKAEEQS